MHLNTTSTSYMHTFTPTQCIIAHRDNTSTHELSLFNLKVECFHYSNSLCNAALLLPQKWVAFAWMKGRQGELLRKVNLFFARSLRGIAHSHEGFDLVGWTVHVHSVLLSESAKKGAVDGIERCRSCRWVE